MVFYKSSFLEKDASLVCPDPLPESPLDVSPNQLRIACRLVLRGYPVARAVEMGGGSRRVFRATRLSHVYKYEFPMLEGIRWSRFAFKREVVEDRPKASAVVTETLLGGEEL